MPPPQLVELGDDLGLSWLDLRSWSELGVQLVLEPADLSAQLLHLPRPRSRLLARSRSLSSPFLGQVDALLRGEIGHIPGGRVSVVHSGDRLTLWADEPERSGLAGLHAGHREIELCLVRITARFQEA